MGCNIFLRVVARRTGARTLSKMAGWIEILCPLIRLTHPALSPTKKRRVAMQIRQPSYQAVKIFILIG